MDEGKQVPEDIKHAVEKDVSRTFPEHEYFTYQQTESCLGLVHLEQLLLAYAALDPEVGYCQGLNFLAGCILLYCQELELAFQVLNVLLVHQNMRVLYLPDLRELQDVMDAISLNQPDNLQLHFKEHGVVRSMFLPTWIMTVFSADFHPSVAGDWLLKTSKMETIVDVIKEQLPALPLPTLHRTLTWALEQCHERGLVGHVEGCCSIETSSDTLTPVHCKSLPLSVSAVQATQARALDRSSSLILGAGR